MFENLSWESGCKLIVHIHKGNMKKYRIQDEEVQEYDENKSEEYKSDFSC